jgi:deoxynucleoside triphosphate triphosphohydrolase SAMHD1
MGSMLTSKLFSAIILHQALITNLRFDYIARDAQAVSTGNVTDLCRYAFHSDDTFIQSLISIRLLNSARVIDGQICYSEKNQATVYGLFEERFKLHKRIYNHKTGKASMFEKRVCI